MPDLSRLSLTRFFGHSDKMVYPLSLLVTLALLALWSAPAALAARDHPMLHHSGLPVPRFVSLKSDKINVRIGPGKEFAIGYVYRRTAYPVEITEEFGHWRKIRDIAGREGWVHYRLLSPQRTALASPQDATLAPFYASASHGSPLLMELEAGVLVHLIRCKPLWCEAELMERKGWMPREALWGLYDGEVFDD